MTFSGFGKFSRRRAGRPRGPQPEHGREDPDRRLQGPEVHGRLRPEEVRQVLTRASFGDRLTEAVAARDSQIVLGLDPDPGRLWPEGRRRGNGAGPDRAAVRSPPTAGADRRGRAGLRGRQAPGRVLRAARRAGLGRARGRRRPRARGRPARARRRQARRHRRLGRGLRRGLLRRSADIARGAQLAGPRGRRADRQPAARPRDARVAARGRPAAAAAGSSCSCGPRTPARPTSRSSRSPAAARSPSGWPTLVAASGPRPAERSGRRRRGRRRHGARAPGRACASGCRAAPILLPGIGAQGGRVEDLAPALAPGRAGGLVTASRSIARAHEATGAPSNPPQAARAEAERLRELGLGRGLNRDVPSVRAPTARISSPPRWERDQAGSSRRWRSSPRWWRWCSWSRAPRRRIRSPRRRHTTTQTTPEEAEEGQGQAQEGDRETYTRPVRATRWR